ncbi:hypothetical protein L596_029121 [Steinernema carpocapsae]|uniref:Saposin B-type domain-containing protein n=1 Tax=Steinernema carpocapsae TaxID=34508 RepID=A0A4U5LTQ4_STECR|nr:hypothetical protein L596_029121 [Steinernema carpocapsae]
MRALALLLCFVVIASVASRQVKTQKADLHWFKKIVCTICYDVVEDTENWVGEEGQKVDGWMTNKCLGFFGKLKWVGAVKNFCNDMDAEFEKINKRLENTKDEDKDATLICGDLHACPARN